jgi:hypothetical protein
MSKKADTATAQSGRRVRCDQTHDAGLGPYHVERPKGKDHEKLEPGDEPLGHLFLLADGHANTLGQSGRVYLWDKFQHAWPLSSLRGYRRKKPRRYNDDDA